MTSGCATVKLDWPRRPGRPAVERAKGVTIITSARHTPLADGPDLAAAIARLRRRRMGAERRATTAALAPYARAVGAALACGTRPARRYWGDCYRRAAAFALDRGGPDGPCPPLVGLRLVHGTCHDSTRRWAHAWVELPGPADAPDGLVFCGVRQRFYDRAGFYRVLGAEAEAVYRPAEAAAWLRATQRYGPWHRGALGGAPVRRLTPLSATPPRTDAGPSLAADDRAS
jgi:hypothetical protein